MAETRTNLTEEEKNVMLYLKKMGKSNPEIQRITGRSRTVVQLVTSGTYDEYRAKLRQQQAERVAMRKLMEETKVQELPENQITKQEKEFYRFNAKFPIEYKAFMQEMAWRNRLSINDYLIKIVGEYMEANPSWKEPIDIMFPESAQKIFMK